MTPAEKVYARYLFLCADISNYMPNFLAQTTNSIQLDMLDLVFRYANGGNCRLMFRGWQRGLVRP